MVIIFKKGNKKDLKNYRLICLLSNILKYESTNEKLENSLDENQPSRYSMTEHIHVIIQLKEKCREYNIPLCIAFVDYEKAFNSVQTQAVLTLLQEQGLEDEYNGSGVELRTLNYENPGSNRVKTLGKFFHYTLLQFTQLYK